MGPLMSLRHLFLLPFSLFLACGEPWTPAGDSTMPSSDSAPQLPTSGWMTASQGGAIRSADGRARLVVPPGALLEDAQVTLAVKPAEDGTISAVYVVEPTSLATRLALSIEIDVAAEVPLGRRVSAARRDGDRWVELPVSADDPGAVAAPGKATGVLRQAAEVAAVTWEDAATAAPTCDLDALALVDCSGSPMGRWRMAQTCAPELAAFSDPFQGQCESTTSHVELQLGGSFEIGELAMVVRVEHQEVIVSHNAPSACIDGDACAALGDASTTCRSAAGRCSCENRYSSPASEVAHPISIEGDVIVASDGYGQAVTKARFCRQGDRLLLDARSAAGQGPSVRYVLERE